MRIRNFLSKYPRRAVNVLKNEGVLSLGIKSLQKVQKIQMQQTSNPGAKKQFISLVDRKSVMAVDWSGHPYVKPKRKVTGPYTVNWVMSPPSGGGGHQNIFRFIEYLDKLGYKNNIYLYTTYDDMTLDQARKNVKAYCKAQNLTFKHYK